MATQQQQGAPSRPWFRLATMVRPPPRPTQQPDQAPPPPARPAFIRPTIFTQVPPPPNPNANVVATSPPRPPPNVVAPTSPPRATVPPTPPPPPNVVPPRATVPPPPPPNVVPPRATVPRPSPIPRVTTSPPPPTINSPPPSPLRLPSPQLNTYQQKTSVVTTKGETLKNNYSDSDDVRMMRRIITIAGENKGAIMELSKKALKPSSDGDSEEAGKKKNPVMNAIMNSNVQGVNNSILYNCSTSHHDPGVHLSLSRKPNSGTK